MQNIETIKSNRDFQRVYKRGKRAWNSNFTIYYLKNHRDETRFGITVTKKIGNAVERNRLKRRIKEIIRHHREILPIGYDIIIIPKKNTNDLVFNQLEKSLLHVFSVAWKAKK